MLVGVGGPCVAMWLGTSGGGVSGSGNVSVKVGYIERVGTLRSSAGRG